VILWDLFDNKIPKFFIPKYWTSLLPSTGPVDRCRSQSTSPVDRLAEACMLAWTGGPVDQAVDCPESSAIWKWPRLTSRSTGRELLLFVSSPGRPTESRCSLFPGPVDRAVDRWHNGHKNDRWLVDWPVDRKVISDLCCYQQADLFWGYKYPLLCVVLGKFLKSKNPHLLKCFSYKF